MKRPGHPAALAAAVGLGAAGMLGMCGSMVAAPARAAESAAGRPAGAPAAPSTPPDAFPMPERDPDTLKDYAHGKLVRDGLDILQRTRIRLPAHVGNRLSCTNCHLDLGRRAGAAPWVGVYAAYPQYHARTGGVDTLEDRINDCFERSLNGKALPAGAPEMKAIVTAMAWLSEGVPVGRLVKGWGVPPLKPAEPPDANRGRRLYAQHCACCHAPNGQGVGEVPPLWGNASFNVGAGMARQWTAASFIRANMPLGQGGALTPREAHDIAAWVLAQPRPDFPAKGLDWPQGGKPPDCPY